MTLAALGLALGASVGLVAPASATTDTGFTAQIDSAALPLVAGGRAVTLGGTKAAGSALTSFTASDGSGVTGCAGLGAGSTTWSCSFYPAEGGWESGDHTIVISETNADGTAVDNVFPYIVYENDDAPEYQTVPTVGYSFVPGGVNLAATTGEGDNAVGIQTFVQNGESESSGSSCPADADSDNPTGTYYDYGPQVSCLTTYPADSLVTVDSNQGDFGDGYYGESDSNYGFFFVPDDSIININPATVNVTAQTVTVTGEAYGSAFNNSSVVILNDAGAIVCPSATFTRDPASGDATLDDWSCTTSALGLGTHTLTAAVEDQGAAEVDDFRQSDGENYPYGVYLPGGLSPSSAVGTFTFTAPIVPTAPSTVVGLITPVWSFTVSGDLTDLHPGDTITVTGSGLPAGTTLDVILHSTPTDLGTVVAASDGTFTQTDTIPQGIDIGPHTIIVTATGTGLVTTTQNQAITVTSKPAAGSGGKTKPVAPAPTATHDNGGSASGSGIAPNILTRALTPIADVATHPNKIVSALEIGLVLLLLAVLPAHLLNATIAEQSDRFERRFGKLRTPNWLFRLGLWFRSAPVAAGILVTLATAILFGFADPKFGFTLASLRLILAAGIALFLVGYVANALTGLVARVQWNIVAAVSTRPYGLILTIVGVIISRALHFSPGFLIGLILGLTIQGKSAAGFAWRTVVLRSSIVLVMAIAAWIGYSTLTLGGSEGGTFWSALVVETLVAITTEGVVALLVELLPLRFLEGERVYAHSRVLWGIFYFLTVVVFVLAVVPWEGNWDALHGSLWIWIVVLAAFAAICVGIYIYFRRFAKPLQEEAGNEEVALGETVSGDRT